MKYSVAEYKLKRGGKGLIVSVPEAPVVSMEWQFRAGYRYTKDYEAKTQVPHIMEHMVASAMNKYPSVMERDAVFCKNGAYSNALTNSVSMRYVASCADFEWERIMELMRDEICDPYFSQKFFETETGNVRSELTGYLSNAGRMLSRAIDQAMGSQDRTYPQMIETLKNIKLEDLIEHYNRTHTMGNMRFVIAGDFTNKMDKLHNMLEGFDLPKGERLPYPKETMHAAPAQLVEHRDVPAITFGFEMFIPREMDDKEAYNMGALNHVLNGTMGSRIYGKARSQGLLYGCGSGGSSDKYNSSWEFAGRANPDKLAAVFDLIVAEIKRVADGIIDDQDIADAKSFELGKYRMGIQTAGQLAGYLSGRYFYDGVIKDYDSEPDKINSISKDEMVRLAREFLTAGNWSSGLYGSTTQAVSEQMYDKLSKLF